MISDSILVNISHIIASLFFGLGCLSVHNWATCTLGKSCPYNIGVDTIFGKMTHKSATISVFVIAVFFALPH